MVAPTENALDGLAQRVGDLDRFVADRLGYKPAELGRYFSAEQIDALALALDNMDKGVDRQQGG